MSQEIKTNDYSIFFSKWDNLRLQLASAQYGKIIVLVDDNTEKHCLPIFQNIFNDVDFDIIKIKAGEAHKTLKTCQKIWSDLLTFGADRHSLFINLGGGVIGDMGGFCASTFMRGIDFIQVPTTLLSMVDASVGGKLAVDFEGGKNLIGLFRHPKQVLIDPDFLATLPKRELKSGFAEVLKHALIADSNYWNHLKSFDFENADWTKIIRHSVKIKKEVVTSDFKEQGLRKTLNFGHSIGHAVESVFLLTNEPVLHGEAVIIGMICESFCAKQKGLITDSVLSEVTTVLVNHYPDLPPLAKRHTDILENIRLDKKNKKGKVLMALIDRLGHCLIDIHVPQEMILEGLDYYDSLK